MQLIFYQVSGSNILCSFTFHYNIVTLLCSRDRKNVRTIIHVTFHSNLSSANLNNFNTLGLNLVWIPHGDGRDILYFLGTPNFGVSYLPDTRTFGILHIISYH